MRSGFLMMAAVVGVTVGVGTAQAGDHHHHDGGGHATSRHSSYGGYHGSGHYGHYGSGHYAGSHYGYYSGHSHYGGHYGGGHASLAFGFGFGYPAPYYGSYGYYGYAPYPPPYYGAYPSGPAYGYGAYPPPGRGGDDEGDEDADNVDPTQMRPRGDAPNGAARLRVIVTPADASVYVDGRMAGTARDVRSLAVAPGQHRVEAVRPGYEGLSRVVDVGTEEPAAVEMDLEPAR